jgi:23S rRNA pseudouridine1911/1915/1917 synthase
MKSYGREPVVKVLYSDNHLLAVDKPAGIATQPDLCLLAKAWVKEKFQKPGAVFLEPIHRLDRVVSGIVLFARTSKALSRLQAMMREQKIERTYLAWLEQAPPQAQGRLVHRLSHGHLKAHLDPAGKEAVLTYDVLRHRGDNVLVKVRLETGRYHQIRAQFSAIGCPVVGDTKYGGRAEKSEGILLHHTEMAFAHPVTGEDVRIESQPVWL